MLKETWVDKVDGVDDVLASHINGVAQAVIALEDTTADFDTALDELHAYAEALKGGEA